MEISSRKNDIVRLFRSLFGERKTRYELSLFAAEGDHLCGELCKTEFEIEHALYTKRAAEKYPETVAGLLERARDSAVITEELSEYISDTKSPQGVFAAVRMPKREPEELCGKDRLVILDGVQDPGNVGTVIRTAEALGIDGAVLSDGCADIWSPKTLRASMGSVYRLPCITGNISEIIKSLKDCGFSVYGAMLDESAQRIGEIRFPEKSAVVIGSEGSGVSAQVQKLCGGAVYIPISGAESLNAAAAAAIILWELSRR
jgi:TrmH family RNA methyltransferase